MTTFSIALSALLVKTVFPIISAIIAAFVVILLRKLSKKTGIQVSDAAMKLASSVAMRGVAMAEERGAAAIKNSGAKLGNSEKLNIAVSHIMDNIPGFTAKQAADYAHAAMARLGAGATVK